MIVGDVAAGRPAVVAFGANLGDRRATVLTAVRELAAEDGVEVTAVSDVVESVAVKPAGEDPSSPAYLNGVVLLRTTLAAPELLAVLNRIEDAHGRVRVERWGDRTLDLDLVDYDGEVSDDPGLTLPHPRAAERDFVLGPWLQVDPDATLVGRGRVADLLTALKAGR